jgi:uncharacterized protein (TIGR03435 family)
VVCWTLLLLATAAFAQPSFEVASVKPSPPPEGDLIYINLGTVRNGEVTFGNASLSDIIKFAYGLVGDAQLEGPDWIRSKAVGFDIIAKAPPKTPREDLLLMVKTLLNERFHLKFHLEPRSFSHLVLSVAKNGPKMKEVAADPPQSHGPALLGHIVHPQISMYTLSLLLSRQMQTVVIDRTGLKGVYEIDLKWTPEGSEVDNGPTIYTALQEQLGLRLESRKDPVDVMVVESADRVPVEN